MNSQLEHRLISCPLSSDSLTPHLLINPSGCGDVVKLKAGERIRTADVQLGKLTFYH